MKLASLCYHDDGFIRMGDLFHAGEVSWLKITRFPPEGHWFIANCRLEEPPYIEGDLYMKDKVGHIHTRDNPWGDVQYFGILSRPEGYVGEVATIKIELEDML